MPITIILDPSGPPKRQIIELAFGDLSLTGYEFGRTPEEIADAVTRLNALMYEWPYNLLGYSHSDYGTGSAEESSGIPYETMNGVAAALALRLAAAMGRTMPPEARANLASAMAKLHAYAATIPTMPLAGHTVRGSGARGLSPFINEDRLADTEVVEVEETSGIDGGS